LPGDLYSQEYPFVHPSKPLVTYILVEHHFVVDAHGEERHYGDWDSLNVFDLELGEQIASISRNNLRLPSGIVNGWIAEILAFTDMGLYVKAGLSEHASRVDYFVAELDIVERILKPLAPLPATFM